MLNAQALLSEAVVQMIKQGAVQTCGASVGEAGPNGALNVCPSAGGMKMGRHADAELNMWCLLPQERLPALLSR